MPCSAWACVSTGTLPLGTHAMRCTDFQCAVFPQWGQSASTSTARARVAARRGRSACVAWRCLPHGCTDLRYRGPASCPKHLAATGRSRSSSIRSIGSQPATSQQHPWQSACDWQQHHWQSACEQQLLSSQLVSSQRVSTELLSSQLVAVSS